MGKRTELHLVATTVADGNSGNPKAILAVTSAGRLLLYPCSQTPIELSLGTFPNLQEVRE